MSALALSPPESSSKKMKKSEIVASSGVVQKVRGPISDPVENPTLNLKEKLNQRYQEECEETIVNAADQ
jgi:hypothetical protein